MKRGEFNPRLPRDAGRRGIRRARPERSGEFRLRGRECRKYAPIYARHSTRWINISAVATPSLFKVTWIRAKAEKLSALRADWSVTRAAGSKLPEEARQRCTPRVRESAAHRSNR
jgi:hypothetical protein